MTRSPVRSSALPLACVPIADSGLRSVHRRPVRLRHHRRHAHVPHGRAHGAPARVLHARAAGAPAARARACLRPRIRRAPVPAVQRIHPPSTACTDRGTACAGPVQSPLPQHRMQVPVQNSHPQHRMQVPSSACSLPELYALASGSQQARRVCAVAGASGALPCLPCSSPTTCTATVRRRMRH